MAVSNFALTEDRPRLCPICAIRTPSRRHTIYGWICYLCLQRCESGRDADALAAAERNTMNGAKSAPKPPKPQSDSQEKKWEPETKVSATAKPRAASPTVPSLPEPTAPPPTIAIPVEQASPKDAGAIKTAPEAGEPCSAPDAAPSGDGGSASRPDPDALIQDRVQDAMMDEPNLSSVVLAARLGISASGVRSCVCRLRKRGLLPPPARPAPPPSRARPPAGTQQEAIRAAMLAEPTINSKALAARLGTTPDTVRSCISLLRRSGRLPPIPAPTPIPVVEPQPREPMLMDKIQAAMIADPTISSSKLAARFNTSPASVRSAISTLRQRGLLPPAPVRPAVEPDTMRGRLLQLITEQPGIGGIRAAQILGTTESCMHDTFSALRKRGLIAPADPARPGGYPLVSASSQEPPMPATVQPDPTPATMRDVVVAIAEALGLDDPAEATEEDILQVVREQSAAVTRLLDEKRRMTDNLEINRRLLGAAEAQASTLSAENDRLRNELAEAAARRLVLTPEQLAERIADDRAADKARDETITLYVAADRADEEGSADCATSIFDVDLSIDDLRALAALRKEQARVLRQRALEGR